MRRFVSIVAVVLVAVAVWLGSALVSVSRLAAGARDADGAAVLARTDLPAVRRSLTEQIVRAYLANASEARKVSQIERMVATTYGTTVTDAMVARLLTAETLTQLLKQGRVDAVESVPALEGVPALADLKTGDLFGLLGRIGFVQPVLLSVRVSQSSDPEQIASIHMHLDGSGWRLAAINLPKASVRQLVASLPAR